MTHLTCFKAYDIRGRLGDELNESVAYAIGRAYGELLTPKSMALGGDVRETSEALKHALAAGLMDTGVDVVDLGLAGTEEVYFAAFHLDVDGGIEVTASHNPIDYNGMKLVGPDARPISGDSGLKAIQAHAESLLDSHPSIYEDRNTDRASGHYRTHDIVTDYIQHLLTYVDVQALTPLKLVVNAGNGAAGHIVDALEQTFAKRSVPVELIKVHNEPDPTFPNGIPNPLLPENRADTANAVIEHRADMGIAWDGDFDRCFLFDENGEFIEGYYIVGLLAEAFLKKSPGEKIIHDPRLTWNTRDMVTQSGGTPVMSKTGHAFIKERMRKENAIYGGEMSAHHYFRDFAYCDSGMIPWLLVAELISKKGQPLSQLVRERIAAYPSSGEINRTLSAPDAAINAILEQYQPEALSVDHTDGISLEFADWRFNLRKSNTEPVLRLNVESRADRPLMQQKTDELLSVIDRF